MESIPEPSIMESIPEPSIMESICSCSSWQRSCICSVDMFWMSLGMSRCIRFPPPPQARPAESMRATTAIPAITTYLDFILHHLPWFPSLVSLVTFLIGSP